MKEEIQWYYRKYFIIIAIACVGPLALPLIWWRPHTNWLWKAGLTIVILVLSWLLYLATMESLRMLMSYYNQLLEF